MSVMEYGADECRVCYSYSNSGFDICEECAKKEERERIIKIIKNTPSLENNYKKLIDAIVLTDETEGKNE